LHDFLPEVIEEKPYKSMTTTLPEFFWTVKDNGAPSTVFGGFKASEPIAQLP